MRIGCDPQHGMSIACCRVSRGKAAPKDMLDEVDVARLRVELACESEENIRLARKNRVLTEVISRASCATLPPVAETHPVNRSSPLHPRQLGSRGPRRKMTFGRRSVYLSPRRNIVLICRPLAFLRSIVSRQWQTCCRKETPAATVEGSPACHCPSMDDVTVVAEVDLALMPRLVLLTFLFEQRYSLKSGSTNTSFLHMDLQDNLFPSAPRRYRGVHLFVLVHGFQSNSFDLRLMKDIFAPVLRCRTRTTSRVT